MALANVPLAGQTLAVTRDPIRNNFATIDAAFSVDHGAYGSGDQGLHLKVTFPAGAAVAPGLNQMVLYSKLDAGTSYLYVRKNNGVVGPEIPWTQSGSNNGALGGRGYTYLPSGVLMKWGTFTTTPNPRVVTASGADFPGTPAFTNIFSAQVTTNANERAWVTNINSPATVTVQTTSGATSFMIFIIGNVA